jgi:hypothetical protein
MLDKRTAIITGAQQGIGAGLVEGFLKAGYNVVATSLHATASLTPSPSQILVDGDIPRLGTWFSWLERCPIPAHCHGRPRSFFQDIPEQALNPTFSPSVGTETSEIAVMVGF